MKDYNEQQFIPRVNQIDAMALDKEIIHIIKEYLLGNLQLIAPALCTKVQPELELLIRTAIWLGSVGKQHATFGQQLLALAYDSRDITPFKLAMHYCLTVMPSYWKNFEKVRSLFMLNHLLKVIKWADNTLLLLRVLNLFRFLKTGSKPTLVDFILNLNWISLRQNQQRNIGYRHLTRELLWGGFMEMLGLVLPLINFRKIHRFLGNANNKGENTFEKGRRPEFSFGTVCAYCNERPTLPRYINCGHIYCYYCLSAHLTTDSMFYCTKCNYSCSKDSQINIL